MLSNKVKRRIIRRVIAIEGGFVDDPSDSGGATKYGITEKTARLHGYTGSMRDLTVDFAYRVYSSTYWTSIKAGYMPEAIADKVFDMSVNIGVSRASRFLQRALNSFNHDQRLFEDLAVDGHIGVATINALNRFCRYVKPASLLKALNALQGSFYIQLSEKRPKDRKFINGWLTHRVH